MKKEHSSGCVIYKLENEKLFYLVIRNKNGMHYSFPKGHIENGETALNTAKREVFEETNIKINIFEKNKAISNYQFLNKDQEVIDKEVTFYLAEAVTTKIKIQESEISEAAWIESTAVYDLLTYQEDKDIFHKLTKNLVIRNKIFELLIVAIISVIIVMLPDLLKIGYLFKSIIKISIFLFIPLIYTLLILNRKITYIKIKSKTVIPSIIMGVVIYVAIIAFYIGFKGFFDFSNIGKELLKIGITKKNFVFVGLYIPIINAFLEEFFFRGFVLSGLERGLKKRYANIISALLFAQYHVLILSGWSSTYIIFLAIIGLFILGLFFNYIASKTKNIIPTYIIHMFANLGINTIALFILGII